MTGAAAGRLAEVAAIVTARYPQSERPALAQQAAMWAASKPLAGLRILDATPVFTNTMAKYVALLAAGAELSVGAPPSLPHDPAVLAKLPALGLPVVTEPGESWDVVLDCAGAFASCPTRMGAVELTRTGAAVYAGHKRPVLLVDDSPLKRIETSLGTGDGFVRAMAQLGHPVAGMRLVVFGAGKVGSGIAVTAHEAGATVSVIDPALHIQHAARKGDGGGGLPMAATLLEGEEQTRAAILSADCVVTATGVLGAASRYAETLLATPALLANMGVEDEFGPEVPAERVLAGKAPVNFELDEPTALRYLDPVLALHNQCALRLREGGLALGLQAPDPADEAAIWDAIRDLGTLGEQLESSAPDGLGAGRS